MKTTRKIQALGVAALLAVLTAGTAAQEDAAGDFPPRSPQGDVGSPQGDGALSPRNASYSIDVRLDPEARTLVGSQVITWRNDREVETSELWFHLYWNAWRNDQSTWLREDALRRRSDIRSPKKEDWGYLVVDGVRLAGPGSAPPSGPKGGVPSDLTMDQVVLEAETPVPLPPRFAAPDDGNGFDRTVMVVDLPRPVAPGETVRVELDWHSKVPRTFARTGVRREFFFIAQWFPKLGVFEGEEGWNCHQYHAPTEYFSDYGVYDVRITLPERFVVGATGREADRRDNGDGTATHRFVQADVHDFTWTASPDYRERLERFEEPDLPAVDIRFLYQAEHEHQVERHLAATRAALKWYGTWYGPYPYGHVTVIDPAWRSGAGGMEYPTLFTCGTGLFRPRGGGSPEGVTVHEAGHQFWYGIVGNNEFEHAWLDEGLNTFSTTRTYHEVFGTPYYTKDYLRPPGGDFGGFVGVLFPDVPESRETYGSRWIRFAASGAPTAGAQSDETFHYFPAESGNLSYAKTALWLYTLERHLGWETVREILSTFFDRYKFKHPRPEDFFAVADEVAGQDLGWFFDQVWGSSVTFDYAVSSVTSKPARVHGFVEGEGAELAFVGRDTDGEDEDGEDAESWHSEVVVRRQGEGVFPVKVLLVFEDGSEEEYDWDGSDRWKLFVVEKPSKLRYAAVDPGRVLLLDLDLANNSRLLESQAAFPARKWASKWMIWLQDLMTTLTFFV